MKRSPSTRLFMVCACLGVGLLLIILALTRFLHVVEVSREVPMGLPIGAAPSQTIPPNEPLGELGSHCGGPLRLPCRPGLLCSVDGIDTPALGLCVRPQGVPEQISQLNEICELGRPCAAGLFCAIGSNQSTCKTIDVTAPKITRFTLEGMQFDAGTYLATAGTKVTVNVQAVNAKTVRLRLKANGQDLKDLQDLAVGKDGVYTGTFTMSREMNGVIEVLADAPGKGFSVVQAAIEAMK